MKLNLFKLVLMGLLITWTGAALAQDAKPQGDEGWRSSLEAFTQEVIGISEKTQFPNPDEAYSRNRSHVVFTDNNKERIFLIILDGGGHEFHANLALKFTGPVSWQGVVDKVETNTANQTCLIRIKLPLPKDPPTKFLFNEQMSFSVPLAKFEKTRVPAQGEVFAFKGMLKKDEKNQIFEPVFVLYGMGSKAGKVIVNIGLIDVEPAEG